MVYVRKLGQTYKQTNQKNLGLMRVPYHDAYLILNCIHTKQHLFFITWATLGLHDTILDWMVEAMHVVSVSHETNVAPKVVVILR